jgi:hypothetical protein
MRFAGLPAPAANDGATCARCIASAWLIEGARTSPTARCLANLPSRNGSTTTARHGAKKRCCLCASLQPRGSHGRPLACGVADLRVSLAVCSTCKIIVDAGKDAPTRDHTTLLRLAAVAAGSGLTKLCGCAGFHTMRSRKLPRNFQSSCSSPRARGLLGRAAAPARQLPK